MNKKTIKQLLPPFAIRMLTGVFYGWYGNYSSWSDASGKCNGYSSPEILEKVRDAALKVRNGDAAFERDSVVFYHPEFNFPVLSGLLWIAGLKGGKLNVLDFGGSLGSTYFQHRLFLDHMSELNWGIVEQPNFVHEGNVHFKNENLHFFESIEDCLLAFTPDVFLFSSVLQYLENPFDLITKLISTNPEFILVDRTPFINGRDRITVQKVNPGIYKGCYPCWFFNKEKFTSAFSMNYDLIIEFDSLDVSNIRSEFRGFIFKRKAE